MELDPLTIVPDPSVVQVSCPKNIKLFFDKQKKKQKGFASAIKEDEQKILASGEPKKKNRKHISH